MKSDESAPNAAQGGATLLDKMKELRAMQGIRYNIPDVALATAIVLLEVASSDHAVNRFERSVIHTGLKGLFQLSDESTTAIVHEAQNHLRNMRGSSSEAALLKDVLDPYTKKAIVELIDKLIHTDGNVDGIEIYLRRKFRAILGLPEEPSEAAPPPPKTET